LAGGVKPVKKFSLKNSKGISVLFLVIAMLLMITIGYVFSYLIPTKQKSVRFPIYSTQAFYIAQSGVEFAIRYAQDQGWRGTTDSSVFDLTRLTGISRPLGNGTFTINYDQPSDTLTSTGQFTGSSEKRVVRVSNFNPCLKLVFDSASPEPCWCNNTRRVRFYIRYDRNSVASPLPPNIIISSFSATWTYTGTARNLTRIFMNGTSRYNSSYANGGVPVNLSSTQTITPGQLITILIYWSGNITNGANINITFYTGTLGTGNSFKFNLDAGGNYLPTCTAGC
jgi:hypothetical protein